MYHSTVLEAACKKTSKYTIKMLVVIVHSQNNKSNIIHLSKLIQNKVWPTSWFKFSNNFCWDDWQKHPLEVCFTGKHLYRSLFLIKLQAWRPATLLKCDSNTGVFLWNLRNFYNTSFEEHIRTTASRSKQTDCSKDSKIDD